jgi:L-lactate utilization protein LutB
MHFYETCPFTICALNTPNVIHTLGQVQTQKLFYAEILHYICSLCTNCSGCCPIHTKQAEIYKEHDKKEINATNAQR